MKYRVLGSTGMKVSVVGLGTWQLGGEWGKDYTQKEADAIIGTAKDEGINLIDTAECYGDHTSESLVGGFIEKDRDAWIVATKFGHRFTGLFERDRLWKPGEVRKQLEASLRALRTGYVDLYQFHSGTDEEFATEGLWEELSRLVDEGKIRHIGISIGQNTNTVQTEAAPRVKAEAIQVVYNRLDRAPEEAVFPWCRRLNLGVLARVPLASGFLSGKYRPGDEAKFVKNDVRSTRVLEKTAATLRQVEEIGKTEVPQGVNMASWALAWCLQHPAVTAVIPGCKDPGQVVANARAADLDLVSENHPQAAK